MKLFRKAGLATGTALGTALLLLVAYKIAETQNFMVDGDFFSFWLAGRMTWTGEHPYSEADWVSAHYLYGAEWISDPVFLYPLPLSVLFAAIGWLPLKLAAVLWVFLSLLMILLSVGLIMSRWKRGSRAPYLLPVLAGVFLFRPLMVTLRNGQLGGILLLILALVIHFWEQGDWLKGGLILPILALKPNLGLPLLALVGIWLALNRRWRVIGMAAVMAAFLLLIGLLRDPGWIQTYVSIGNTKLTNTLGHNPTVWGLAGTYICDQDVNCTLISGSVLTLALIIVGIYFTRLPGIRSQPALVMALVIPVAVFVPPYLWVYDQILLVIPLLVGMGLMVARELPYLLTAVTFLGISAMSLFFVYVAMLTGTDVLSSLVAAFGIGFALMWILTYRPAKGVAHPKLESS